MPEPYLLPRHECANLEPSNRPCEFQKRGQLVIGVHNESLYVIAVCIRNPDGSPLGIQR